MNFALKSPWLILAGTACLTGMLNVACATQPDRSLAPPAASAPPASAVTGRAQAAIANATTKQRSAPPAAASRSPEVCKTTMAKVADPNPPLNVRSGPETTAKIVGKLDNGTWIEVKAEKDGWFEISSPVAGWVSTSRTQSGCNQKTQRVNFPANGDSATITDRFIGTGSHKYLLKVARGQTMTVRNLKDVFPMIVAPDGKLLAGDPYQDANRTEWTGQLTLSGDYSLQLDSNYKGYEYSFTVTVK